MKKHSGVVPLSIRGWLVLIGLGFGLTGCGGDESESTSSDAAESASAETATPDSSGPEFITADASGVEDTPPASATTDPEPAATATQPATETQSEPASPTSEGSEPVTVSVAPPTVNVEVEAAGPKSELDLQLEKFEVPPAWLVDVELTWDVKEKPWEEGRQEIRRLLGKGDNASRRQGIRMTWDYLQKGDIGDGHEYGMYMFLGNEPLWAVKVYREWLARTDHKYPPYFGIRALASLYADYGQFEDAEQVLQSGLAVPPPDAKWKEMRMAEMHDSFGDLYAKWGKLGKARTSYLEAARLYPLGKPPYGGHLLPRRAKKVRNKLTALSLKSFENATLKDGSYRQTALGYSGDIKLNVKISGGHIADIDVQHQEKIDQNACKIIPQRIIEKQSLQVDGISGATVTKDALVAGTLRALQKAGLK